MYRGGETVLKRFSFEVNLLNNQNKGGSKMNYEDILERFNEINVTDLFGTKKEVRELPNVLRNDEIIMYATSGFVDGNTWLITCTDKRIVFLDKGMIYGLKQVDIPIEKINSVSHKKGLIFGSVTIHHGSDSMEVSQIRKDTLNPLVDVINNEIEKHKTQNKDQSQGSSDITYSAADEILKFKALLDADVITKEEFEKKKNEILNF